MLADQKIVVTQPKAGTFAAFTAVCTHAGCLVDSVSGGTINCPCHGSKFSITNGSVVNGPASSPLAAVGIKVQGSSIRQGLTHRPAGDSRRLARSPLSGTDEAR